jgi:hypothetical protein
MKLLRSLCVAVSILVMFRGDCLSAEPPIEQLTALLPDDIGLCLLICDARGHWSALQDSPFVARLEDSALGKKFISAPEIRRLFEIERQIEPLLGTSFRQVRDDLVGDAVVLAFRPGSPQEPDSESGVFLTWARHPRLPAQLLERLNELQKQGGELKEVREQRHRGRSYWQRKKADGTDEYYYHHGQVLAVTPQEALLKRIVERHVDPSHRAPALVANQLKRQGADAALATLWINPRAFDEPLLQKLGAARGGEAAFLKTFQKCWSAIDGFALKLRLDQQLDLDLSVTGDISRFPGEIKRFLTAIARPSSTWTVAPNDGLAILAITLDLNSLAEVVQSMMTPEERTNAKNAIMQGLGSIVERELIPKLPEILGPDILVFVTPPISDETMPGVLAGVRIRSSDANVDAAVLDAMNTIFTLVRVGWNANATNSVRLKSVKVGSVDVRCLVNEEFEAAGFVPCYALKDGFLLVATSPKVVERFSSPGSAVPDNEARLAVLSVRRAVSYLMQKQDALSAVVATNTKTPKAEVIRELNRIRDNFELIDRIELSIATPVSGRASLRLRLVPVAPMRR